MTKRAPGGAQPREPSAKIAKRTRQRRGFRRPSEGTLLLSPRSSQVCVPRLHLPHVCNNGSSRELPPAGFSRGRKKAFDQVRESLHEASFRRMILDVR